jgi:hypothetical protein
MKVRVYLWMMETVRPGNDIYSDTWAKAILSRNRIGPGSFFKPMEKLGFRPPSTLTNIITSFRNFAFQGNLFISTCQISLSTNLSNSPSYNLLLLLYSQSSNPYYWHSNYSIKKRSKLFFYTIIATRCLCAMTQMKTSQRRPVL